MRRLTSLLAAFVSLALVGLGLSLATAPAHAAYDRDCGDFGTQQEAQDFFLSAGGPGSDPHRLDADGDGSACDSLPCPCGASAQPRPKPVAGGGGSSQGGKVVRQRGNVVKVVDGDTVRVRLRPGRATRDVRLIGVDTPEVHGGSECWGPEASAALERVLPVGSRVSLVSDPTQARTDRYGRLLRYVAKGGKDVNRMQVANGSASVYVHGGKPFQRTATYQRAEAAAQADGRGLWGACG